MKLFHTALTGASINLYFFYVTIQMRYIKVSLIQQPLIILNINKDSRSFISCCHQCTAVESVSKP